MPAEPLTLAECEAIEWDAIVIGTGMGGATAGYELARLGRRVLFVEKGPFLHLNYAAAPAGLSAAVIGVKDDSHDATPIGPLAEGRWPHRISARTNLGALNFRVPVGCISGGSSAFYAAALERFAPADFEPGMHFNRVDGTTLPDRWPISYTELAPWYANAEKLYRVRGTQDPLYAGEPSTLMEPPVLNPRDRSLSEKFKADGLHPYQLHVACEFLEGCDGCLTGPCERGCRRDAAWTCLIPALTQYDARLLPECEVLRLEAGTADVEEIICAHAGTELRLRARVVVLAAGAFATPALLLRSLSADWPDGLANRSGQVGRNLMFHGGDLIAVSPDESLAGDGPQKTLALNDYYFSDGTKLGTFQSLGTRLDVGQVMQYLRDTAEYSTAWWRWLFWPRPVWWRKLTSPFVRIGALMYFYIFNFSRAAVWVSIIEDLPYYKNRVYPDPDNMQDIIVEYHYSEELQERVMRFRALLRKALGKNRFMILSDANKIDYPHVSGTCRFGDDPETSVLDRNGRAHGLSNLYVVDASFFPSSGGTNPSLTISANALRVASLIHEALSADSSASIDANLSNRTPSNT